ncbi:MAG: hypothetical protein O3A46_13465, partial [Candidatus Poribacteria bacterium]|nr:hypothetical protein [Candidatus Poribacteria bacterium]
FTHSEFWFGARKSGEEAGESTWYWTNGEPWGYAAWREAHKPGSNDGGLTSLWFPDNPLRALSHEGFMWLSRHPRTDGIGYLIEFDAPESFFVSDDMDGRE